MGPDKVTLRILLTAGGLTLLGIYAAAPQDSASYIHLCPNFKLRHFGCKP
jgi:hypothetical protein